MRKSCFVLYVTGESRETWRLVPWKRENSEKIELLNPSVSELGGRSSVPNLPMRKWKGDVSSSLIQDTDTALY